MLNYNTLENVSFEMLQKTFIEAFSDYEVKIEATPMKLKQMLKRRGYNSKASIGASKDEELVGFVLNGIRNWNGKLTAYDTGTAVIKSYRKQGITTNMFLNAKQILQQMGIEQYLLEVIQTNTSAVELYRKQGFEILRHLECYRLDKDKFNYMSKYKVEHINIIDENLWRELSEFWDNEPSWQNSIDSINAVSDAFIYAVVRIDDNFVGYGVIEEKSGDIPLLAVKENYRGKGIGKSIVSDLVKTTEATNVGVLNVDSQCEVLKSFLQKVGFLNTVNQYEMLLKL